MKYLIFYIIYICLLCVSLSNYYLFFPDSFLLEIKENTQLYNTIKHIETWVLNTLLISFFIITPYLHYKLLKIFEIPLFQKYFSLKETAFWGSLFVWTFLLCISILSYFLNPYYSYLNSPFDITILFFLFAVCLYLIFLIYLKYHLNKKFSPLTSWVILALLGIVCFYPFLFLIVWIFWMFL